MARPYLSLIIPAHNEAERLPATLIDMDKHLSAAPYSYEILVIDDGSSDKTTEVATKFAKLVKNLKVISNGENKGKGAAVKQGMLLGRGEVRAFTDADHSASISQFDEMTKHLSVAGKGSGDKYDLVVGSRFHKESELDPPPPFAGRLLECVGGAILDKALIKGGIRDVYCGFKAFTADAAERIFTKSVVSGWGFDAEVLALAGKMGMRIKEMPIVWSHDPQKVMPASAYLHIFGDAAKIAWWLNRGKYQM